MRSTSMCPAPVIRDISAAPLVDVVVTSGRFLDAEIVHYREHGFSTTIAECARCRDSHSRWLVSFAGLSARDSGCGLG